MTEKIDKLALVSALRAQLEAELSRAEERARDAAEAATHPENRAESDKDMRSTEASYLARGHSERVAMLAHALAFLSSVATRSFDEDDGIESTALVQLKSGKQALWYFLLPVAGGERIRFGGRDFQVLSPSSPLGSALLGLSVGDEPEVISPQGTRAYGILSVS